MTKRIENKDRPLMKNVFIEKNNMGVYGWYGLEYFEISDKTTNLTKQDLQDLRDCLNEMLEEIKNNG